MRCKPLSRASRRTDRTGQDDRTQASVAFAAAGEGRRMGWPRLHAYAAAASSSAVPHHIYFVPSLVLALSVSLVSERADVCSESCDDGLLPARAEIGTQTQRGGGGGEKYAKYAKVRARGLQRTHTYSKSAKTHVMHRSPSIYLVSRYFTKTYSSQQCMIRSHTP